MTHPSAAPLAFAFTLGALVATLLLKLCTRRSAATPTHRRVSMFDERPPPAPKRISLTGIVESWRAKARERTAAASGTQDVAADLRLRVAAITWNVGAQEVTFPSAVKLLEAAEPPSSSVPLDLVVLGLQEVVPLNAKSIGAHSLGVGKLASQRADRMAVMVQAALYALYREDFVVVAEPVVLVGLCSARAQMALGPRLPDSVGRASTTLAVPWQAACAHGVQAIPAIHAAV